MASSGLTTFKLTMTELFEESFERAICREMRTGYDFRTALRTYNLLTLEWQNRGYNLWTITPTTIPLTAGIANYPLDPVILDVVNANYVRLDGSELPLTLVSLSAYTAVPNKTLQGYPTQYTVNRGVDNVSVSVWPVPDVSTSLKLWYARRIEDGGNGVNTPDVPMRFYPALIAGLAYNISQKHDLGAPRIDMLKMAYEEAFDLASSEERDKAGWYATPERTGL